MISRKKLQQRAEDKLEAQLFFANKLLEEYELTLQGVIPTKVDNEMVKRMIDSQLLEVNTLMYINNLLRDVK